MGKRIIQQARGHGGNAYRVRRNAYKFRIAYLRKLAEQEGTVAELVNSTCHTAPLAKIKSAEGIFYTPACEGLVEKQMIKILGKEVKEGNIIKLKDAPVKTKVFNVESRPGDGGKFVKTAGSHAIVSRVVGTKVILLMPSKEEKEFQGECLATVGVISGHGRKEKPILKAGKMFFIKKSRNKLWPRTSAVKMNVIDHPFGSGRGKRIKSKIAKRNAPAGARVGHIRPSRTGKKR
ncbi:50S ribosomal protein L2 [Candidatus Pacearchaeota archaeon]|nr:50S ribosomal protein L2 [Candidatus Pacearchaeota archaeon]